MSAIGKKTLLIRNGTLIDGSGGAAVRNDAIVIEGNRIKSIGRCRRTSIPKTPRTWR